MKYSSLNVMKDTFQRFNWNDKSNIYLLLFCSYLFLVLFRFITFAGYTEVQIMFDEMLNKGMALQYFKLGKMYYSPGGYPHFLYQLLITFSFLFGDNFLVIIKLINALLINLTIFPIFIIAKEFGSNKQSFIIAIVSMFISYICVGCNILPESLYYPLFILIFYLLYKSFTELNLFYSILGGICLGLLYITKTNALAVILFIIPFSIYTLFFTKSQSRLKVIRNAVIEIVIAVFLILVSTYFIRGKEGIDLGLYTVIFSHDEKSGAGGSFFSIEFFKVAFSYISAFSFIYLIPFIVAVFGLIKSFKSDDKKMFLFLSFGLGLFIMHLLMVFSVISPGVHSTNYDRIYGRSIFMVFPFFLISFITFFSKEEWNFKQKITLTALFIFTTIVNYFILIPKFLYTYWSSSFKYDLLDGAWLHTFFHQTAINYPAISAIILYGIGFLNIAITLYFIIAKNPKARYYLSYFIIFSVIANISVYYEYGIANKQGHDIMDKNRALIKSTIPDNNSYVALIYTPNDFFISGLYRFWFPFNYTLLSELSQDKEISSGMIPQSTEWVISLKNDKAGFKYRNMFHTDDCYIYDLKNSSEIKLPFSSFKGIFNDGWSKNEFTYSCNMKFDRLILFVSSEQFGANKLRVNIDNGFQNSYEIGNHAIKIELPFSSSYSFSADKIYKLQHKFNKYVIRDVGIKLDSIQIEK